MQQRIKKIMALGQHGFVVTQVGLNHFRVNRRLDLFPLHNEWYDMHTQRRGSVRDLVVFVKEWLRS